MSDLHTVQENLLAKGYDAIIFEDHHEAIKFINKHIDDETVGIAGSMTIQAMDLFTKLSKHNTVYWHEHALKNMSVMDIRRKAIQCDVYISSVNAISISGEIVNIDHTGNRVAGISFGPKDIYLVIGKNKLCSTLTEAIKRARNIAAPLNAQRLNRNTPCSIHADKCHNCKSDDRICRILSIFLEKPAGANYHILLINEDMGY